MELELKALRELRGEKFLMPPGCLKTRPEKWGGDEHTGDEWLPLSDGSVQPLLFEFK